MDLSQHTRPPRLGRLRQRYLVVCDQTIERLINRLKQHRRVATRYEKLAANYLAMLTLAAIRLWL